MQYHYQHYKHLLIFLDLLIILDSNSFGKFISVNPVLLVTKANPNVVTVFGNVILFNLVPQKA